MRNLALIVLLALTATIAPAQTGSKDVTVKTDRFTGFTKTEMEPIPIGPLHGFPDASHTDGYAVLDLSLASGGGKILLVIESTAKHRQFPEGADVHALADGQRIDLGHLRLHRAVTDTAPRFVINETIGAPIDRSALAKIAAARNVEIRIGSYEATLTVKDIERVRAFVAALPVESR